ncbi:hypothetical protein KIW84_042937 [Lathyrus oleraceus]|uniref:DUF7745 domain-containing protein n=1 Tax=Pisum sativum TaxID=3888 RepID=A0A9D4XFX1_PEA|nr:hypothetical protein KIW84_042937 [Pisum sativum]
MHDSKKGFIPMQHGMCLSKTKSPSTKEERDRMNKIPYASAIGSIMYAMLCTRLDISYALSATSRYQSDPCDAYWVAVKNILKYLRSTKDSFLIYGGQEELAVIGYTDASFQTDKDDFRSQFGYVFCLNGGAVSWKSSKQDTVVDSTTEVEYIAASSAVKEAVWIKKFINELGIVPSIVDPIGLYCDNNGAIAQAKEPRSHQRSKHILRRYHLIREIIDRGDVKICIVPTLDNIVDPLTKPLAQQKHDGDTRSMGIREALSSFNVRDHSVGLHQRLQSPQETKDCGRRNTKKYSFRYSDLKELRKLTSFVLDPLNFKQHHGKLLSILSADVVEGLLSVLGQFYDTLYRCFTFLDFQLVPTLEDYSHLLGIPVSSRVPLVDWRRFPDLILLLKLFT